MKALSQSGSGYFFSEFPRTSSLRCCLYGRRLKSTEIRPHTVHLSISRNALASGFRSVCIGAPTGGLALSD
jgi:hypothetical protein